ncbi:MAG: hypothetical protein RL283_1499 [Actinomycetota bacterium]|jgi:hypothetical protein
MERLEDLDGEKLVALARDAAYAAIGFGVLSWQKVQVRRRELGEDVAQHAPDLVDEIAEHAHAFIDKVRESMKHHLERERRN